MSVAHNFKTGKFTYVWPIRLLRGFVAVFFKVTGHLKPPSLLPALPLPTSPRVGPPDPPSLALTASSSSSASFTPAGVCRDGAAALPHRARVPRGAHLAQLAPGVACRNCTESVTHRSARIPNSQPSVTGRRHPRSPPATHRRADSARVTRARPQESGARNGRAHLIYFPHVECVGPENIVNVVVSAPCCALFIFIAFFVQIAEFDLSLLSPHPGACGDRCVRACSMHGTYLSFSYTC